MNQRRGTGYTGISIAIQRVTDAMLITSTPHDGDRLAMQEQDSVLYPAEENHEKT